MTGINAEINLLQYTLRVHLVGDNRAWNYVWYEK